MARFSVDKPNEVSKAYSWVEERNQGFYTSSLYSEKWTGFERRQDAYYQRHRSDAPAWRSKLHLATFFNACKALDAQFKASHASDPFIFVSPDNDSTFNPVSVEKAALAQADLNHDLSIGNFREKLDYMYWYVEMCGTAVGREYIRTEQERKINKKVVTDQFGVPRPMDEEVVSRKEYTVTDIIHPLNFAHEIHKPNFRGSEWGGTRLPLPVHEIYKMVGHKSYYQPGVKKLIKLLESGKYTGVSSGQTEIYLRNQNEGSNLFDNTVVVYDYSGPLNYRGNEDDHAWYYCLYVPAVNEFLRISETPFKQHPFWKMQTYPDPDGPFGVGPADMVLPINWLENSTVNQSIDYANIALKYMYEVQPDNITVGFDQLIEGLPLGMIPLEPDIQPGSGAIRPVQQNTANQAIFRDQMSMIEKYKQEMGPTSLLRGKGSNQLPTDTATGISLLAQREDDQVAMLQAGCDAGIQHGLQIKLQNTAEFFREERFSEIDQDGNQRRVRYYPYEYGGLDYSLKVKREVGDVEAGKNMSFFKLLTSLDNMAIARGTPMPFDALVDVSKKVGRALGIDNVDETFSKIQEAMGPNMPPQIGAPGQPPAMAPQTPAPVPGAPAGALPEGNLNALAQAV